MSLRSPVRPRSLLTGCAVLALGLAPLTAAPADAAASSDSHLRVVSLEPEPAPAGGETTVRAFVANEGPETTANPIKLTINFPRGSFAAEPFFPPFPTCFPGMGGHSVTCTFPAGLRPGRTATALIPAAVYENTPVGTVLTGGAVTVSSPDDPNPMNNGAPFSIVVS
ncbi:hypothetical protein [Kitasatospora kifunensis]|uniref:DUF11 domain-containing protein n=1 Tax=Kitasatospora kifunensis TaxID=58351 RepID=A0A7W7R1P7_KITKI|nr:hypothetical protein [Kitasatospora kifunensis]MBB4923796.1 hypothetical protein [Kitasatospora kifunensis]